MPKYYLWTIGCQMNQAESERLGAYLEGIGYNPTPHLEDADLVILNTCVVRQHAEEKAIQRIEMVSRLKRREPHLKLAVTGCLVETQTEELQKKFPGVDYFFPPGTLPLPTNNRALNYSLPPPKISTYIPIIQGCNHRCTYCIVPYRRGPEKSRPLEEILSEAEQLVARGAREVILLGQNVNSYGRDLPTRPDLGVLLAKLNSTPGLWRIRFLTSHPRDMTPQLIEAIATLGHVCKHLNLPLQAGDDHILKAMGRGYDLAYYRELIHQIRALAPDIALSTDIIVGFPGEGEEEFRHTLEALRELRFDTVHVAAYSPRPGTPAASYFTDNITPAEKTRRLKLVEALHKDIVTELNSKLQGKIVEVLVTGQKGGRWQGRTESDKLVFFDSDKDMLGMLLPVRVTRSSPWSLQGELI